MSIKVNFDLLKSFVTDKDFESVIPALNTAHGFLYENNVNAPGNHAHGWLDLPINWVAFAIHSGDNAGCFPSPTFQSGSPGGF